MAKDSFDILLGRYAELIVKHGLNVQPGQIVNLAGEVPHRELLFLIAQKSYACGAAYVNIDLIEPRALKLRVESSTLEQMSYSPAFLGQKYRELVDRAGANLRIVGPEDPDLLKGLDPEKINGGRVATYQAIKYFYEEGIGKSKVHWNVAAGATEKWGQRLFPEAQPAEACRLLWEQLFKIARVENAAFLSQARVHDELLQKRAAKLSALKVDSLRFTGPGTDLVVGLSERAKFKGGSDKGPLGVGFEPNIPSEECFSSPDWRRTSGRVRVTRPFLVNGTLIKGLEIEFVNGEVANFVASEGADTLRAYLNSDAGGRRLGEVALVGVDSPIFLSGLVFEEILLDENAACHIAVGSAYKFCIDGADTMSADDFKAIGCNESSVHTDMMISDENVDVVATLRDGSRVTLLKRGAWQNF